MPLTTEILLPRGRSTTGALASAIVVRAFSRCVAVMWSEVRRYFANRMGCYPWGMVLISARTGCTDISGSMDCRRHH